MTEPPSPSSKAGLSAGDHLGPYQIVGVLGEGGMGVVYRAHDSRLHRDVALKIMRSPSTDPAQLAQFLREARAAGSLSHPNIVAVYDVGTEGATPYVVAELLEGETLRERMRRGLLPLRKSVDYGVQIAHALDAAHRKNIWHRDVKPANVFITDDGRVKLLDFGIAKLAETDPKAVAEAETAEASQTKAFQGTPGYMSPEQVLHQAVDHRTDIFALGSVLYEMFTGARAFQRASSVEAMSAVLQSEPPDPLTINPDLSPLAAAVVRRCLEKNRDDRFQSARDLAFQLQQLKEPTTGVGLRPLPAPPRYRRWLGYVAVALAGAAVAAGLLWALARPSQQSPQFQQLTFSLGRVGAARLSSDGTNVTYSVAGQKNTLEILRIDVSGGTSLPLDYHGMDLLAVRAGEIALMLNPQYVQGQRFVGQLGRALRGGEPTPGADHVEAADWSPSGELAVVRSDGKVSGESWIEYPSPATQPLCKVNGIISFLRVSPNGERVAFLETSGPHRGSGGMVSVVDRKGNVTHLTGEFASARGLAWSPSGEEVWFAAADSDTTNRALRAVTLGGHQRLVYEAPGALTLWDIAADGRVLLTLDDERRAVVALAPGEKVERDISAYDQSGVGAISSDGQWFLGGDRYGVLLRRTDGSDRPKTLLPAGLADDLAADGETVLATVNEKLVVQRRDASGTQPLPAGDVVSYAGAYWFPDNPPHRVLFTGTRRGEDKRSFVQEVQEGIPKPITDPGTWGVAISPNGKWIAGVGTADGKIPLWSVDDGSVKYVPGVKPQERPVAFSTDGNSLWFFHRGDIPASIYKLDLMTGKQQFWKSLSPPDAAGVYAIGDFVITPSGNAYAYSYSRVLSQLYLVSGLR